MESAKTFPIIHPFEVTSTSIDGLYILKMKQVEEERGVVREFFRQSAFVDAGITGIGQWKQINATYTIQGAVRGLHAEAMIKLVAVIEGEAFGAYVDLRPGSSTRGNVVTVPLKVGTQVLIPNGVGNGFQSISEGGCQYLYCFNEEWVSGMPGYAVCPIDPALGIQWPIPIDATNTKMISIKDANAPTLAEALRVAESQ